MMETTGVLQKQQNTLSSGLFWAPRRGADDSKRDASPAVLLPNDLQHSPHHVAHGCLRRLGCRHPLALSPDQIHELPWKQGRPPLPLPGAHPPHDIPTARGRRWH